MQQESRRFTPDMKINSVNTYTFSYHESRQCSRTAKQTEYMTMSGRRGSPSKLVKSKEGIAIRTTGPEQRARWVEYFQDILNRPPSIEMPNTAPTEGNLLNVNLSPPSIAEIEYATEK